MRDHGLRDSLLAGAIFLAFGGAFAYTASTYEVGSLLAMGPGYFPLVLGLILVGLGVAIMATGVLARRAKGAEAPTPPGTGSTAGAEVPPDAWVPRDAEVPPDARVPTDARAPTDDEVPPDARVPTDTQTADTDERGPVPWARGGLILLAILVFGATVDGLGLAAALFVTVLLAALAGQGTSWRRAAVISAGLTALSVLIFVVVLQLRLQLVGPWLGG